MNDNTLKHNMANKHFSLKFCDGTINSLKNTFDSIDTEYVLENHRLGEVKIYWREENTNDWFELSTIDYNVKENDIKVSDDRYEYSCLCNPVQLDFKYELEENSLFYTITLKNTGDKTIEIGDLVLSFPMNKDYKWDKDADLSVFRHSLISMQNSHIYWMRASSTGPYLAFFPQNGSGFEYFSQKHTKADEGSIFKAYIHAMHDNEIAKEKGCEWRQKITSHILKPNESKSYSFKYKWVDDYTDMQTSIYDADTLL